MIYPLSGKRLLIPLLLILSFQAHSQSTQLVAGEPVPAETEEEAPKALWEGKLGDRNMEVVATGTWDMDFLAGTGFSLNPEGLNAPVPFPGLTIGWLFTQSPLLNLSIRMDERYFFQVDYQGEWRNSSFLLGYEGLKGENLRWIKGGTAPFAIPVYGDWTLGESQKGILQGALGWDSSFSTHDLLLRREAGGRETKKFRGNREIRTYTWSPDQWSREEFYRLPVRPVRNIKILVEDQAGIREPFPGEWAWNEESGTVRPLGWKGHKAYVTWEGISPEDLPEGSSATLEGKPGVYFAIRRDAKSGNPEAKNIYRTRDTGLTGEALVRFRYRGTDTSVPGTWIFDWSPEGSLTVWGSDGSGTPFEALLPGMYQGLPSRASDYELSVEILADQEGFLLGPQVITGSLEVTYNGVRTTSFVYKPEDGSLEFPFPVFSQDIITVSFDARNEGNAKILGAQGNRWNFSPNHWLDAGILSLITWEPGTWTNNPGEKPGRAEVFLQHRWETPELSSSLTLKTSGGWGDFTGLHRWYGAEGIPYTAPLASSLIRPAAVPLSLGGALDPAYSFPAKGSRGKLIHRDYSYRDFSGYQGFKPYQPDGSPGSYGQGSNTGPYLTGGFEGQARTLLATEFRLGPGQWTGSQVFFEEGRVRDLSSMTRISFSLRWASPVPTGVKVFLQLGVLGEDLDGNGSINLPQTSPPGLPFLHGPNTLIIPQDEINLKSEDWENKGWLLPEPETLLTWEITQAVGGNWTAPYTLDITPGQRELMERVNSYRIVLLAPTLLPLGQEEIQGVILSSAPVFEGSNFKTEGAVFLESRQEESPWSPPGDYPASRLAQENQGRMTVRWESSGWSGQIWNTPVPSTDYRWFAFFARNRDPQIFTAEARISDSQDQGYTWTFTLPPDDLWHLVRVNLETGETFLDEVPQGAGIKSGMPETYSDFRIHMTGGSSTGTLMVDELHFYDSVFQAAGQGRWSGTWKIQAAEGLRIQAGWNTAARTEGSGEFFPSLGVFWGPLTLEGDSQLKFTQGQIWQTRSGYHLGLTFQGLQAVHRFREGSWREDRLIWTPDPGFRMKAEAVIQFQPAQTKQDWSGGTEVGSPKEFLWSEVRTNLTQLSPPAPFTGASFTEQWTESWKYLGWDQREPHQRTWNSHWKTGLSLGFLTLSSDISSTAGHGAGAETFRTGIKTGATWKSHTSEVQSWTLGLDWDQDLLGSRPGTGLGGWDQFFTSWSDRWAIYAPVLITYPGREWFSEGIVLPGTLPAEDLKTVYQLKTSRPRTLSWWDLLPSFFQSTLRKEIHREGTSWERWSWENQLEAQLMNAFGKNGYLGAGSWFDTDKGSLTAGARIQNSEKGELTTGFTLQSGYSLWAGTMSLGFQNKISWGQAEPSGTTSLWTEFSTDAPAGWKFPYISPPRNHIPKVIHRVGLQHTGQSSRPLSSLLAEWSGRWEFDPKGSLKASVKWGQDWKTTRYNTVFQGGLGLSLSF